MNEVDEFLYFIIVSYALLIGCFFMVEAYFFSIWFLIAGVLKIMYVKDYGNIREIFDKCKWL